MRWARSIALVALVATGVDALPKDGRVSLVPWKVVSLYETIDAALILYWVPASPSELRRSELLTSDDLARFSSRCVAMRVVRSDDEVRLASLTGGRARPFAVLTDRSGRTLGAVSSTDGVLPAAQVEGLVRLELDTRSAEATLRLDRARQSAEGGDMESALALYRQVWAERCLCPRQGKAAQRALRKLEKK